MLQLEKGLNKGKKKNRTGKKVENLKELFLGARTHGEGI